MYNAKGTKSVLSDEKGEMCLFDIITITFFELQTHERAFFKHQQYSVQRQPTYGRKSVESFLRRSLTQIGNLNAYLLLASLRSTEFWRSHTPD